MRKIKEVLRLYHEVHLSERAIRRSVNLSRDTVSRTLTRFGEVGLSWPLTPDIDDTKLETLLFPNPQGHPKNCEEPNWSNIHLEYKKKGVTLQLLWEEYKAEQRDGYQYSQFCERYRQWKKTLQISMRQEHRAGEKMFVDYAGPTVPYVDLETGELLETQVFVAVLGATIVDPRMHRYWVHVELLRSFMQKDHSSRAFLITQVVKQLFLVHGLNRLSVLRAFNRKVTGVAKVSHVKSSLCLSR